MLLSRALRLSPTPCLALTGAGGKTTALFKLARELPPPVIVTATTHLHVDQVKLTDSHWMGETSADFAGLEENLRGVMLVTGPIDGDRTTGLNESLLYWLHAVYGFHDLPLLVEADGARQKPLKAPAEHEPVIPDFVETVVVVAGMSGLGKPLTDEFVHRPEIFARLSGLAPGETVTPGALLRVLTHPSGGLKNIPSGARRVALLNQADTPELQAQAKALAEGLLSTVHAVVIASLQQSQIHAVHEPVAGIILAAGEARRFGQPKQLLDWHGQPFVRVVA
ncbi:MAG: selenium cofactor biosynthesis protein YqeC, partial [Anaerolineales bacterium]|nr:selenium cofactor biosynthesis protein YqeC [Anaerolineales bacterium]